TKQASEIAWGGTSLALEKGLSVDHPLVTKDAEVVVEAVVDGQRQPYLTRRTADGASVYVLNLYTFTQEDFDAVNEVLLAPRDLGLFYLPREAANMLRDVFVAPLGFEVDAPTRVTVQPFGEQVMIYNYNEEPAEVTVRYRGKE